MSDRSLPLFPTLLMFVGAVFLPGCDTAHCEEVERVPLDLDEEYDGGPSPQDILAAVVGDYTETLRWNQVHAHMPAENTMIQATIRSISGGGAWYVEEDAGPDGPDCVDPRIDVEVSINLDSEDQGLNEWFVAVASELVDEDDVSPIISVKPYPHDIAGDLRQRMTKDLSALWLLMEVDEDGHLVGDLEASRMYDSPVGVGSELVPLAIWGPNTENDGRFETD